jgi:hypothetical protein
MPSAGPREYEALLEDALGSGFAARTVAVGTFVGNDFSPELPQPEEKATVAPGPPGGPLPHSELLRFLKVRVSQSTRVVGWALAVGNLLGITIYDTPGSWIFARYQTQQQRAVFDDVLRSFGRMKRRCDENGRELLVVIFPNRIQIENYSAMVGALLDPELPERKILAYCRDHRIPCLDLLPVLRELYERDGMPLFFGVDRHLNERGTAAAAEAIGGFLDPIRRSRE